MLSISNFILGEQANNVPEVETNALNDCYRMNQRTSRPSVHLVLTHIFIWHWIKCLLMLNKLPQLQQLKSISTYYHTVSGGSEWRPYVRVLQRIQLVVSLQSSQLSTQARKFTLYTLSGQASDSCHMGLCTGPLTQHDLWLFTEKGRSESPRP